MAYRKAVNRIKRNGIVLNLNMDMVPAINEKVE